MEGSGLKSTLSRNAATRFTSAFAAALIGLVVVFGALSGCSYMPSATGHATTAQAPLLSVKHWRIAAEDAVTKLHIAQREDVYLQGVPLYVQIPERPSQFERELAAFMKDEAFSRGMEVAETPEHALVLTTQPTIVNAGGRMIASPWSLTEESLAVREMALHFKADLDGKTVWRRNATYYVAQQDLALYAPPKEERPLPRADKPIKVSAKR